MMIEKTRMEMGRVGGEGGVGTTKETLAISRIAASVKESSTPSDLSISICCFIRFVTGSVKIAYRSSYSRRGG